jgi:predicted metalloprotease
MRWQGRRKSENMEDRRGMGTGGKVVAGGGFIGLIILFLNIFGGENAQFITPILEQINNQQQVAPTSNEGLSEKDKEMADFVATILAETEDVWTKKFKENGLVYKKPKLILFREKVESACGFASSASGPFYCPGDQKVYMDLAFFEELKRRFGAQGGDFAIAYVIAHEIGHHVQYLLGTLQEVQNARTRMPKAEGNALMVALELQADFYAGVWAHDVKHLLEDGDIEQALDAAAAVGDDTIQKRMQGYVVPETFTHGTSKQRYNWLKKGFLTGDLSQHDTFNALKNGTL